MSAAASLRSTVAWAWRVSPGLTVLTIVNAVVLVVAVPLRLVDPSQVAGVPVWDKPIKFALAFLAFGPTMLWIYGRVRSVASAGWRWSSWDGRWCSRSSSS